MLKPGSVPDLVLSRLWAREPGVLYDARILAEYREVLGRAKFKAISRERVDALLALVGSRGVLVGPVAPWHGEIPDDDDRMFVEVAKAFGADAIITGNLRDYPSEIGVAVYPPATLLAMLA